MGRPRVFAGMFRPRFEDLTAEQRDRMRGHGYSFPLDHERNQWLKGLADQPLYFEDVTYRVPEMQLAT